MINTPPSERPPPPTSSSLAPQSLYTYNEAIHRLTIPQGYGNDRHSFYGEDSSAPNTPRAIDEYHSGLMLPAASAAAALAQLHNHKLEPDWESENVGYIFHTYKIPVNILTGLDVGHRGTQASYETID